MRGAGASGAAGEGLSEGVGLLMAGVHGTAEPEADRKGIAAEGEGWLMVRGGVWQECGQRQGRQIRNEALEERPRHRRGLCNISLQLTP